MDTPSINKYTSIFNINLHEEKTKFDIENNFDTFILNINLLIQSCINYGLTILQKQYNVDVTIYNFNDVYSNYKDALTNVRNMLSEINDYIISNKSIDQDIVNYINESKILLDVDFEDYNKLQVIIYESEDKKPNINNIEYYEFQYRIKILTNNIILNNILYILQQIQFSDNKITIEGLKSNNQNLISELKTLKDEYDKSELNYNTLTTSIKDNLFKNKYIKKKDYNIKFIKYYLKTFYLNLENNKNNK
jgi:hypothetical protein